MNKNWNCIGNCGKLLLVASIVVALLAGCGGGGGGGGTAAAVTTTGVVYPIVVGLSYQTNSGSGVVAADGKYTYKSKENVTFSAGGVELATVPAAAQVTPIPLDNDVASTNLLRLFKALDTDGDLSNGITLPQLATSTLKSIDLTSETSVAAVLASLVPTATLPAANDAQVATALAGAKATALQNMGTYGSTYRAIIVAPTVPGCVLPYFPKDAMVNLTSQPNWATGAIAGSATLTLNDNSIVTFPFSNVDGTYTASGSSFSYSFGALYRGGSRVIRLYIALQPHSVCTSLVLRDNSQPNKPPVPRWGSLTQSPLGPTGQWTGWSYSYTSIPTGALGILDTWGDGSKDYDGMVVSQTWASSKGKTGTGNTFSEDFNNNEKGSITMTATDDEGATASTTWQINAGGGSTPNGATPTVTAISTTSGAAGTVVIITGTNFNTTPANNTIKFNGTQATVTAATATSLTVTVPVGATTGTISVTTANGTATSAGSFTVSTAPSILTLTGSPNYSSLAFNSITTSDRGPTNPFPAGFYYSMLNSNAGVLDSTWLMLNNPIVYTRYWEEPGAFPNSGLYFEVDIDSITARSFLHVYTQMNTGDDFHLAPSPSGAGSYLWCEISPSTLTPSCASAGINVSRSLGSISFTNTPMNIYRWDGTVPIGSLTLNGTLTFTPF